MADVRIAHLRKRYRMPADALGERSRFDRVLQAAIDEELFDAALERAGIPVGEEICIRRVESVVRLEQGQQDGRLAVEWSVALADAIARRLSEGGPDVIRYRTRYLALVDMACSATRGDLDHAWAWRSLGIWRAVDAIDTNEARTEVVVALAREPRLAPAMLAVVARRGLLPLLVSSVPVERWVALARASLVEWDVSASRIEQILTDAGGVDVSIDMAARRAALRIVASSALARAIDATPAVESIGGGQVVRALTTLALLASEPGLVASDEGVAVVGLLAQRLKELASASTKSASAPRRSVVEHDDQEPTTEAPHRDTTPIDESREEARECAATSWGGLLFLLHIVHAVDLPAAFARDGALAERSLRWSLHQLAMLLVPLTDDDPAALAFAGLAPGSRTPCADEPLLTDAEATALRRAYTDVVTMLRERMRADDENDAELIRRVAVRSAEIVAEPAWLEIRLSATEVSTGVRRAGLDLDPGWIPWLGVVVRFVYV